MEEQIEFCHRKLSFEMDASYLFEGIKRGEQIKPIDVRKFFGFENEHIPGAINIPHREILKQARSI
jgi:rhodanese-related sulfurtransferase